MNVVLYPLITEKGMNHLEKNKLQVVVDVRSTKNMIKNDIKKLYGHNIISIRTMMTMKGKKKAIITFKEEDAANEIATRLGLI